MARNTIYQMDSVNRMSFSQLRLRSSESENARLEMLIREKEAKIVRSEKVAKDLMSKAEEFEDMFVGESESTSP
jgi:hypothetical protein